MTSAGDPQAKTAPGTLGFAAHDHGHCVETAMAAAQARCAGEGLQFTPVRRKALEILLQEHRALGAYDILEFLREEGLGSQPPVAYRALDFLMENGFVHRIERLNAFVACLHPREDHAPAFLICTGCDSVAEATAPNVQGAVDGAARKAGFDVSRVAVEVEGLCHACRETDA